MPTTAEEQVAAAPPPDGAPEKPGVPAKENPADVKGKKPDPPRRGRKRGRCNLSYCTDEVCMHCTCDGSCGRGHDPKLCGRRRYEKRANCNQCKVSYYAIAKRKNMELANAALAAENVVAPPPAVNSACPPHAAVPPPHQGGVALPPHPTPPNWGAFTTALHDNPSAQQREQPYHAPLVSAPSRPDSFPPKPKREELEKWRRFLMEEPPTIVVWDDVKEALSKRNRNGDTSPISNVSSEADLTSLATAHPAADSAAVTRTDPLAAFSATTALTTTIKPESTAKADPRLDSNFDCGELQDPDAIAHASFSSVDDDEGLFNCLLDDMDEDGAWSALEGKDVEGPLRDTDTDGSLFTSVF